MQQSYQRDYKMKILGKVIPVQMAFKFCEALKP